MDISLDPHSQNTLQHCLLSECSKNVNNDQIADIVVSTAISSPLKPSSAILTPNTTPVPAVSTTATTTTTTTTTTTVTTLSLSSHSAKPSSSSSKEEEEESVERPMLILALNSESSSAYRVFQIPELAHSISQYLRPIYISQLRLVSRVFYAAFIPYLRLHLNRKSTASWSSFPLPFDIEHNKKKSITSTPAVTGPIDKAVGSDEKTEKKERQHQESETKTESAESNVDTIKTSSGSTISDLATTTTTVKSKSDIGSKGHLVKGSSYGELVYDITTDPLDNFEVLLPILQDCTNLRTLSISRWDVDLQIFRDVLSKAPRLENLCVSFYKTIDLNVFLATLIIYAKNSTAEQEDKGDKLTPAETSKFNTTTTTSSSSSLSSNASTTTTTFFRDIDNTSIQGEKTENDTLLGFPSLRSLDIKDIVPDINYIRWKVFKSALDRLPNLQHLSLTGIGFRGGKDIANPDLSAAANVSALTTSTAPLAPFTSTINGNSSASNSTLNHHHHHHHHHHHQNNHGDEEEDDDDEPHSLEDGNPTLIRIYPQLKSLSLTFCECPVPTMLDLDRIFPNLASLEMNKCRNSWLHVFEPDPHNPTSHLGVTLPDETTTPPHPNNNNTKGVNGGKAVVTRRVPFPLLSRLKLVDRYEGHEDLIYDIVRNRPRLVSLETHQISLNIQTLLPMIAHCVNERRHLTRFSLSPCWSNSTTRWDIERLFESPSLARVKHIYIQQELSEKNFFSSTLTSLHIGAGFGRDVVIEHDSVAIWNAILRRLPMLESLRIDRYIKDFVLFEGLGRAIYSKPPGRDIQSSALDCSTTSITEEEEEEDEEVEEREEGEEEVEEDGDQVQEKEDEKEKESSSKSSPIDDDDSTMAQRQQQQKEEVTLTEDWTQERPYLQELQVTFRPTCVIQTVDLEDELVARFRFLERLYFSCSKKPTDLEERRPTWRPGLAIDYRRYEYK